MIGWCSSCSSCSSVSVRRETRGIAADVHLTPFESPVHHQRLAHTCSLNLRSLGTCLICHKLDLVRSLDLVRAIAHSKFRKFRKFAVAPGESGRFLGALFNLGIVHRELGLGAKGAKGAKGTHELDHNISYWHWLYVIKNWSTLTYHNCNLY